MGGETLRAWEPAGVVKAAAWRAGAARRRPPRHRPMCARARFSPSPPPEAADLAACGRCAVGGLLKHKVIQGGALRLRRLGRARRPPAAARLPRGLVEKGNGLLRPFGFVLWACGAWGRSRGVRRSESHERRPSARLDCVTRLLITGPSLCLEQSTIHGWTRAMHHPWQCMAPPLAWCCVEHLPPKAVRTHQDAAAAPARPCRCPTSGPTESCSRHWSAPTKACGGGKRRQQVGRLASALGRLRAPAECQAAAELLCCRRAVEQRTHQLTWQACNAPEVRSAHIRHRCRPTE
jgi:hypothetical protein